MTTWNRCDVCGRFISYADLNTGKAIRKMTKPDNHFGGEEYETLCIRHNIPKTNFQKLGEVLDIFVAEVKKAIVSSWIFRKLNPETGEIE